MQTKTVSMEVTRTAVRRLMIELQGLTDKPPKATKQDVYETINTLGCLQIDTINVMERAHHLTLWSRLGPHDKEHLHQLAYQDRRLLEYWAHAASYIPTDDYRYFITPMKKREANMEERLRRWGNRAGGVDPKILEEVMERVRKEGPLATKDFEHKRTTPSKGWWDWKPAKVALEVLYGAGLLLVSHRENFQRHYDLAERVLPPGVDTREPPEDERIKFYITHTMASLGLVKPADIRWYYVPHYALYREHSKQLPNILEEMTAEGNATKFSIKEEPQPYYCLPGDADRAQDLEAEPPSPNVNLLNPFDNALWDKKRVETLFDFEAKLEAYTPAAKRRYGYYYLAILHGDHLVGRIIPKMDRTNSTLIIQSTWHEPWFKPTDAYREALTETLESFASFNGADKIEHLEKRTRVG